MANQLLFEFFVWFLFCCGFAFALLGFLRLWRSGWLVGYRKRPKP